MNAFWPAESEMTLEGKSNIVLELNLCYLAGAGTQNQFLGKYAIWNNQETEWYKHTWGG